MKLIKKAAEVMKKAYAPYSRFRVGCAVEMASGKVYTGSNMENASYGATICAERIAVGQAISRGEREIKRVALIATSPREVTPCGMCLQVISEFGKDVEIISANQSQKKISRWKLSELLGKPYDKTFLTR